MTLIEHGKVEQGAIVFAQPLALPDGTEVVVQIEPAAMAAPLDDRAAATADDPLLQLIDACAQSTGINDLAHQHDHYLNGTPKKG